MKCPKCNYEWKERLDKPKACPRCKIRFDKNWKEEPKTEVKEKVVASS